MPPPSFVFDFTIGFQHIQMSLSKPVQRYMSFSEIIKGRDASVRVTNDSLVYAVELAMVFAGKDRDYAGQV